MRTLSNYLLRQCAVINGKDVLSYLQTEGWEVPSIADKSSVPVKKNHQLIFVPIAKDLTDYDVAMFYALERIASFYQTEVEELIQRFLPIKIGN